MTQLFWLFQVSDFPFYVDPTTGGVRSLVPSISRAHETSLVVESITGRRPPTKIELTVSPLSDVSSAHLAPKDPVNVTVTEDTPTGTEVYALPDGLSYELFDQTPSTDTFSVTGYGSVRLTKALDFEAEPLHVLTLRVRERCVFCQTAI